MMGVVIGMILGCAVTLSCMAYYDAKAGIVIVAHGCAYYAPDTGKFTWGQP